MPKALLKRLVASVDAVEAREIYREAYRKQGKRKNEKGPPATPLVYVPSNWATMLKSDLEAAGIPVLKPKGKLDFHALRTAYTNFTLDVSTDIKTAHTLARHESAQMTLDVYGREKEERCRAAVESVGSLVYNAIDMQSDIGGWHWGQD